MADWTPPEAMVEKVWDAIKKSTGIEWLGAVSDPGAVARAALAASPIGELTQQRDELVEALALIASTRPEAATICGPQCIAIARNALARARER